jgi:MFS family permease
MDNDLEKEQHTHSADPVDHVEPSAEHSDEKSDTGSVDTVRPEAVGGDVSKLPPGYFTSPRFLGSIAAVALMATSLFLGFVLPASTLAVINADLGPDDNYVLIVTTFTLTSGVALTLVGRLGDIMGRRWFLIVGQTFGFVGALVCATAKTINTVIGGTVLVGISAAAQLTYTFVLAELVPNEKRALVNAGLSLWVMPFSVMGPAIARLFVSNTKLGWRWSYYLNVITCGLSVVLFYFFYFPPNFNLLHTRLSKREEVRKIDYVGLILYSASLIMIMLGFSWASGQYPWHSSHVIAALVVGFFLLIPLGFWVGFAPLEQPLLSKKLLKNTNFIAVTVCASVGQMIYFSMNVLWPEQIAILYTTDNAKIGWLSCTTGAGLVVGQLLIGVLMKPIGHVRWILVISSIGMTAFLGALASANEFTQARAIAFTVMGGFFVGVLEFVTIIAVGLICEPGDIGLASGLLGSIRSVAGTIATTIYVTILTDRIKVNLPAYVAPAALGAGLPKADLPALFEAIAAGTPDALEKVKDITPKILAAVGTATQNAYSASFKTVYLTSIAFGGCAIIAAVFTRNIDDKMTGFVARKIRDQ